jgi:HEAT repeat protein
MKILFPALLSVIFCFVVSAMVGIAQVSKGTTVTEQINKAVSQVRAEKTVDARTAAAEHLANLARKLSSKEVTVKLVNDLTSLLDSPDDSVRYWIAVALGNLGPAAKAAAPKLEEMLAKAECINGAITSADGIRYALIKMGIKLSASRNCGRFAG